LLSSVLQEDAGLLMYYDNVLMWSEEAADGRWRRSTYEELTARDKANLDIFWIRDESLEETANLPEPEVLAGEIVGDCQLPVVLGDPAYLLAWTGHGRITARSLAARMECAYAMFSAARRHTSSSESPDRSHLPSSLSSYIAYRQRRPV